VTEKKVYNLNQGDMQPRNTAMAILIGNRVRVLRVLKKLSQRELAKSLGMAQARLHRIETGETRVGAEELQGIANFFGRAIEDFFSKDFVIKGS
jgi:transcriptional regulator with XRE-family HTH domain